LPFLPLFEFDLAGDSRQSRNSSRVAGVGNLTFGVMGGKSGKKWQGEVAVLAMDVAGCGKEWDGWQARQARH
jgi:hypothetical protein